MTSRIARHVPDAAAAVAAARYTKMAISALVTIQAPVKPRPN